MEVFYYGTRLRPINLNHPGNLSAAGLHMRWDVERQISERIAAQLARDSASKLR